MSQFTQPFVGELIGKNKWRVYKPFEYHVGEYPSKTIIYIPIGFVTDFASVPRIFWPIISPIDEHGKAAVVHDYLYRTGLYSKFKSDKIFLEAMEVLKVNKLKRYTMYYTVCVFGWYTWIRYRKGLIK
jgi:hypothetical protein